MSDAEAFTGGSVGEVAIQLVARGETYGVNDAVQTVPLLAQVFENLGDFFIAGHVAREAQLRVRAPACGEFFNTTFQLFVLISESQLGAFTVHGGSNARSDGQFARDANDQYALTGEKTHVLFLYQVNRQPLVPKRRLPAAVVYMDVAVRQRYFAHHPVRPLGHA